MKKPVIFEQNKTYKPDPLFVQAPVGWMKVEGKGLGITALRDIKKGEMIERCPVIIMLASELERKDGTEVELGSFAFHWGPEDDEVSTDCAVVKGGYLALANHSDNCNSDIKQDHKNKLIEWFALRDIKKGEEITIDYDTELWFDNREESQEQ